MRSPNVITQIQDKLAKIDIPPEAIAQADNVDIRDVVARPTVQD